MKSDTWDPHCFSFFSQQRSFPCPAIAWNVWCLVVTSAFPVPPSGCNGFMTLSLPHLPAQLTSSSRGAEHTCFSGLCWERECVVLVTCILIHVECNMSKEMRRYLCKLSQEVIRATKPLQDRSVAEIGWDLTKTDGPIWKDVYIEARGMERRHRFQDGTRTVERGHLWCKDSAELPSWAGSRKRNTLSLALPDAENKEEELWGKRRTRRIMQDQKGCRSVFALHHQRKGNTLMLFLPGDQ